MLIKYIFVGALLQFGVHVSGEDMIGPGKWDIKRIEHVQGPFDEIIIKLSQSKIDRTHYVYAGTMTLKRDLDEGLGIKIEVEKNCDGGFKPFQVTSDSSFIEFAQRFAEKNIAQALENMGLDQRQFPLAKGEYVVEKFPFETEELPLEFAYGHFLTTLCCMDGNKPVGCIEVEYEFIKADDDDDDE